MLQCLQWNPWTRRGDGSEYRQEPREQTIGPMHVDSENTSLSTMLKRGRRKHRSHDDHTASSAGPREGERKRAPPMTAPCPRTADIILDEKGQVADLTHQPPELQRQPPEQINIASINNSDELEAEDDCVCDLLDDDEEVVDDGPASASAAVVAQRAAKAGNAREDHGVEVHDPADMLQSGRRRSDEGRRNDTIDTKEKQWRACRRRRPRRR